MQQGDGKLKTNGFIRAFSNLSRANAHTTKHAHHRRMRCWCGLAVLLCAVTVGLSACAIPLFSKKFDVNHTEIVRLKRPATVAWKVDPAAMHPRLALLLAEGLIASGFAVSNEGDPSVDYLVEVEFAALNDPQAPEINRDLDTVLLTRPADGADVLTPLGIAMTNREAPAAYDTATALPGKARLPRAGSDEVYVMVKFYDRQAPTQMIYSHRVASSAYRTNLDAALEPLCVEFFRTFLMPQLQEPVQLSGSIAP